MRIIIVVSAVAALIIANGVAVAADLPSRKAPTVYAPVAPLFTWTGCYGGLHVGYAGGKLKWTDEPPDTSEVMTDHQQQGAIGGAQLGCNYQVNSFVLGLRGDLSLSDVNGKALLDLNDEPNIYHTNAKYFGTLAARVGYSFDRLLVYGEGGLAFTRLSHNWLHIESGNTDTFSADSNRMGWMLGAGVEYALTNNWSTFIDYNYMSFPQKNISGMRLDDGVWEPEVYQTGTNVHAVKIGLNYKFW